MVRLCFDYGHGGKDPGSSYEDRKEKDDVFKIGKRVANILRESAIKINETRTRDKTVSLKTRSDFEKRRNYDYFISFHRNAFKPEKANGVETYTYIKQTSKAKNMDSKIQKALVNIGFIDNTKDNKLFDDKFDEIAKSISEAILDQLGRNASKPSPPSKDKTLYRVMSGSYAKKDNAEKQVKKLKNAGFDASIIIKK